MLQTPHSPMDDVQTGMAALNRGDNETAQARFRRATRRKDASAQVWMALAIASQRLSDLDTMSEACDAVLAVEAGNLWALVMKGDYHTAAEDPRAAMSFYNLAIRLGEQYANLPPELESELDRARAAEKRHSEALQAHLMSQLAASGYDSAHSSRRFTHSLDLLTGRRQPYVQRPRSHLFPELPQIQFYPRADFAWMDAVEAATPAILAELEAWLASEADGFEAYIQKDANRPTHHQMDLLDNDDWSALYLVKDGVPVDDVQARFPAIMAALDDVPLAQIRGRTPSILISRLKPGAKIPPHHGFINSRLICHLPLIVPSGCGFRVGNETREWAVGQAWAFDDTIEHEAWNAGDQDRFVLIFDIWRPELTDEECRLVATLLEAVDSFGTGQGEAWRDG